MSQRVEGTWVTVLIKLEIFLFHNMIEKSLTNSGSSFSILHFWEKNVVIGGIEVWVAFLQFLVKLNTLFCGCTQSSPSLSVYIELDMWWVVFDLYVTMFETECFCSGGT